MGRLLLRHLLQWKAHQLVRVRLWRQGHWYLEEEGRALVLSLREHFNLPATILDNLLADCESHAEAVGVWIFGSLHLPEQCEQLLHLIQLYSLACVANLNLQLLSIVVVGSLNLDVPFVGKFERVFCEINEDLLQSDLIAD